MGADSKIEWTHHTFNPWIGCAKVSPACKHCYAEVNTFVRAKRAQGLELWGEKAQRHAVSEDKWREVLRWNAFQRANGTHARVFCGSMMDVYERPGGAAGELLDRLRARLWKLIEEATSLDWLLLTKRPENARACVPESWWRDGYPGHVWQGFTAEDTPYFLERWDHAREIPARVRFCSYEPALGPLNMHAAVCSVGTMAMPDERFGPWCQRSGKLHWLIVGSESGHGARPMDIAWVRSAVEQCRAAGVAPFVKQIANEHDRKGGDPQFWPSGDWPREFPA